LSLLVLIARLAWSQAAPFHVWKQSQAWIPLLPNKNSVAVSYCAPSQDGCSFLPFADLVVIAKEFYPIPFRTRPSKPSASMVLRLKPRESRTLPGLPRAEEKSNPPTQFKKAPPEKSGGAFVFWRMAVLASHRAWSRDTSIRCRYELVGRANGPLDPLLIRPHPANTIQKSPAGLFCLIASLREAGRRAFVFGAWRFWPRIALGRAIRPYAVAMDWSAGQTVHWNLCWSGLIRLHKTKTPPEQSGGASVFPPAGLFVLLPRCARRGGGVLVFLCGCFKIQSFEACFTNSLAMKPEIA
jgi:hypothetical protein